MMSHRFHRSKSLVSRAVLLSCKAKLFGCSATFFLPTDFSRQSKKIQSNQITLPLDLSYLIASITKHATCCYRCYRAALKRADLVLQVLHVVDAFVSHDKLASHDSTCNLMPVDIERLGSLVVLQIMRSKVQYQLWYIFKKGA